MNDNDIIKALEVCANGGWCYRDDCPLAHKEYGCEEEYERCVGELIEHALGLVKRQRAEIERLNRIRAELSKEVDRLKTEISYMKSPNSIGDTHEMGAW